MFAFVVDMKDLMTAGPSLMLKVLPMAERNATIGSKEASEGVGSAAHGLDGLGWERNDGMVE